MGIPLLHPWANRVALDSFEVAARRVDLGRVSPPLRRDSAGLAMHGLLAGVHGWRVDHHDGGVVRASFDFGAHENLIEAFPFPRVLYEASLRGSMLSITTTAEASEGAPVPVAFGYHPYFRLPGTARGDWEVELQFESGCCWTRGGSRRASASRWRSQRPDSASAPSTTPSPHPRTSSRSRSRTRAGASRCVSRRAIDSPRSTRPLMTR